MFATPYAYGAGFGYGAPAYGYAGAWGAPYGGYGLGWFNQQGGQQHGHPSLMQLNESPIQQLNWQDDMAAVAKNAKSRVGRITKAYKDGMGKIVAHPQLPKKFYKKNGKLRDLWL